MKKLPFVILILLSLLGVISCEKNLPAVPNFSDYDAEKLNIEFYADKSTSEFEFSTLESWTAVIKDADNAKSSENSWLTLDTQSGERGDSKIVISTVINTTGAKRSLSIIISSGEELLIVKVVQNEVDSEGDIPDKIYPVDFEYLTLSRAGNRMDSAPPAISYIQNNGTVILGKYKDINGKSLAINPSSITQVKDKLVVTIVNYFGENKLEVLDATTLEIVKTHSFGREFSPRYVLPVEGDRVMIVGESTGHTDDTYSVVVADLSLDNIVVTEFTPGFRVCTAAKVGSKIVMIGDEDMSFWPSDPNTYQLVVFDKDNITLEGMRVIADNTSIYTSSPRLVVDKDNNVWTLIKSPTQSESRATLAKIDLEAETLTALFPIANTNRMTQPSIAICNAGELIYIRSHKAFYKIATSNPIAPDDPLFEHMDETGTVSDLHINRKGNIVFLDNVAMHNAPSVFYEYVENSDGSWSRLLDNGANVAPNTDVIYLAKFAN